MTNCLSSHRLTRRPTFSVRTGHQPIKGGSLLGFTLVELLVVMAIVAVLASVAVMALPALKGASDVTSAAYAISGVLEQARTAAMAGSTYVFVGFFEESPSNPGVSGGTGQLVISVVSSADGTNLSTGSPQLNPTSLIQVNKLMKIPNLHLASLYNNAVPTRPALAPATAGVPVTNEIGYLTTSGVTFPYPLTGTAQYNYTFSQIIQFNPQGDASQYNTSPVQLMEIGLQPARGSTPVASSKNLVAIQITGIGGNVVVYRP